MSIMLIPIMNNNAHLKSQKDCGKYVRYGLEAGFRLEKNALKVDSPEAAGDYGTFLENKGFSKITPNTLQPYSPMAGDIMVYNRTLHHQWGHIQMFNGTNWVSDFVQKSSILMDMFYQTKIYEIIFARYIPDWQMNMEQATLSLRLQEGIGI